MKIAVPLAGGSLSMHFGHCESFAIMDVNDDGKVVSRKDMVPPPHEPGVLPAWLRDLGVTHVVAGGMGSRAQSLFERHGIRVLVGVPPQPPEKLAEECFNGTLEPGNNICSH